MGIFGTESKIAESAAVDSIIGSKAKVKGELVSAGSININGEFEGRVESKGDIIISRGSRVVGDVIGGNVTVSGKVDGNIYAKQALEITRSGRVSGDLAGGKIIIEEGSTYRGRVNVNSEQAEEEVVSKVEEKVAVSL